MLARWSKRSGHPEAVAGPLPAGQPERDQDPGRSPPGRPPRRAPRPRTRRRTVRAPLQALNPADQEDGEGREHQDGGDTTRMVAARPKASPPARASAQTLPALPGAGGRCRSSGQPGQADEGRRLVAHRASAPDRRRSARWPRRSPRADRRGGGRACESRPSAAVAHAATAASSQGQRRPERAPVMPPEVLPRHPGMDGGSDQQRPAGREARAHPVGADLEEDLAGPRERLRLGGVLDRVRPGVEARALGLGVSPPTARRAPAGTTTAASRRMRVAGSGGPYGPQEVRPGRPRSAGSAVRAGGRRGTAARRRSRRSWGRRRLEEVHHELAAAPGDARMVTLETQLWVGIAAAITMSRLKSTAGGSAGSASPPPSRSSAQRAFQASRPGPRRGSRRRTGPGSPAGRWSRRRLAPDGRLGGGRGAAAGRGRPGQRPAAARQERRRRSHRCRSARTASSDPLVRTGRRCGSWRPRRPARAYGRGSPRPRSRRRWRG